MHKEKTRNFVKSGQLEESIIRRYPSSLLEQFFEHSFDSISRTIYLGACHYDSEGEEIGIDPMTAEKMIKNLHILNSYDKNPIRIMMNTPGGFVSDGWAIYDAIRASESPVDIEVYGQASSMGAIILQAGRERLVTPHSMVMIHDGYNNHSELPLRTSEAWTDWSRKERERMYEIFAHRSKKSKKFWSKKSGHDFILNAEEAVNYGLADRIIEPSRSWHI